MRLLKRKAAPWGEGVQLGRFLGMTDISRRVRSAFLAAVLLTNGLPVASLGGAVTNREMSCPQHGRACACAEKCARIVHEHPKPIEPPKPACHRQAAESREPEAVSADHESPANGYTMKSCGPETEWAAANGEIRYLPDSLLTKDLHLPVEGPSSPETTARTLSFHPSPPVPPPQV